MLLQRVFKTGNSDSVALPKNIKKLAGIKTGTKVVVGISTDNKTILINKAEDVKSSNINIDFYDWLNNFNKKYKIALEELAKK
jgi:antitoxin component of MazEF toxin-antitoxin module